MRKRRDVPVLAALLAALIPGQPALAADCSIFLFVPDPRPATYDFSMSVPDPTPGTYRLVMSRAVTLAFPVEGATIEPTGPATDFELEVPVYEGSGSLKIAFKLVDETSPDVAVRLTGDGCDASDRASFPDLPPTSTIAMRIAPASVSSPDGELPLLLALALGAGVGLIFRRRLSARPRPSP